MKTRTVSKCECGRRKVREANHCNQCQSDQLAKCKADGQAIVDSGECPQCGAGLRRNSAITGWWQCEQYGAEGFRKDASKPSCSFQVFTV